jgi:endonuclease/exonuclease/phosphatase (EEP) superfamily protein YafD
LPLAHGVALLGFLAMRWLLVEPPTGTPFDRLLVRLDGFLALLAEFTPLLFAPLPLWLLTAALARRRAALVCAAVPWGIFALLYGELFVPALPPALSVAPVTTSPLAAAQANQADRQIRVLTYNIEARGKPPEDVLEVIWLADADIVVVQELNSLVTALDTALAPDYPYRFLRPGGWGGAGIWSRLPMIDEELWTGSTRDAQWAHVLLTVDGEPLHVVNLHLATPSTQRSLRTALPGAVALPTGERAEGRRIEVDRLLPRLRSLLATGEHVVVAGDLNLTDQTAEYRRLLGVGLVDAHRQVGWGFGHTFPARRTIRVAMQPVNIPLPLLRIDYVLSSSSVTPRSVQVAASGGSDHLPVIAELALRPRG